MDFWKPNAKVRMNMTTLLENQKHFSNTKPRHSKRSQYSFLILQHFGWLIVQNLEGEAFEQQAGEESKWPWPCWTYTLSDSSLHYYPHALIWLPITLLHYTLTNQHGARGPVAENRNKSWSLPDVELCNGM
jgi:hypothetical protein